MMDILQKIDNFLENVEAFDECKYISKENALLIIEYIIQNVSEDKLLLETIYDYINKEWGVGKNRVIKNFYKILSYYGIIENKSTPRKTILEKKGKIVVRKFVTLKDQQTIKELLK